jgi:colanic acid/amylovoran biosynthesis glycosyltransferase
VSVRFEGVVAHDRLLERMASGEFDAAIMTSIDDGPAKREGIPVFLMEAMAYGLPVIATRSGATGELADDENALVCEPGNVDAIANAIVRLAGDSALRARLSAAGRSRVEKEFNASRSAAALGALIRDGRSVHPLITPGVTVSA